MPILTQGRIASDGWVRLKDGLGAGGGRYGLAMVYSVRRGRNTVRVASSGAEPSVLPGESGRKLRLPQRERADERDAQDGQGLGLGKARHARTLASPRLIVVGQ